MTSDVYIGLLLAVAAAGLVRGFSGFGAAMVFVPIAGVLTDPETAVVLLMLTDGVLSLPMLIPAARLCVWREVLPLAAGAALTTPFGAWLLVALDPVVTRWVISLLILAAVGLLALGWRYHGQPRLLSTVGVGAASGLTGGLAGLTGPPVILFWMAGQHDAARLRANTVMFFGFTGVFSAISYVVAGLLTAERVAGAITLLPVYAVALALGIWLFRFATDRFFRRLAFTLCAFAAISGLPLLDSLH